MENPMARPLLALKITMTQNLMTQKVNQNVIKINIINNMLNLLVWFFYFMLNFF